MKVVHLSDTHGYFPPLPKEAELVLHTGDFCPNFVVADRELEANAQARWLRKKAFTIQRWLRGRKMLVIQGNHDFTEIVGYNVTDISNKKHTHGAIVFYGMPWVPEFGPWNWGACPDELRALAEDIPEKVDVLMCHAPPYGVLDFCPGGHIGNPALEPRLAKMGIHAPYWLLCGHVHEQGGGVQQMGKTLVMNNATTMRVFDL